jgi:hypothetical protein
MEQGFENFLQELSEQEKILCNDLAFKVRLKISPDTYEYLKKAENLKDFAEALVIATGGGGIATIAWLSSAPLLTKFAIALGLVSVPVTWPVIGAIIGGGSYFVGKKLFNKLRKGTVEEVPKFIKAPIDILALNLLDFLMPVLAKMMIADEQIHPKEREMIVNNLVYKWGYCREFIENYLEKTLNNPKLKNFKYEDIAKLIDSVVKSDKGLARKI